MQGKSIPVIAISKRGDTFYYHSLNECCIRRKLSDNYLMALIISGMEDNEGYEYQWASDADEKITAESERVFIERITSMKRNSKLRRMLYAAQKKMQDI